MKSIQISYIQSELHFDELNSASHTIEAKEDSDENNGNDNAIHRLFTHSDSRLCLVSTHNHKL